MSLSKLELNDIGTLANPASARQALNDNFKKIEDEFKKVVYRDGSVPNSMEADLDMDSHRVLNVADAVHDKDAVNKGQVADIAYEAAEVLWQPKYDALVSHVDDELSRALKLDGAGTYNANGNRLRGLPYASTTDEAAPLGQVLDQIQTAISNPNTELFLQNGDDASPRTVADKLREWVTPEDYGAVGDGVTDDTAAVQAMFDALPEYAEARLPNNYRVTSVVLKTVGVTLSGPGRLIGGTLIIGEPYVTRDYRMKIRGIGFDGDTAKPDALISFRRARRVTITGCKFANAKYGIHVPAFDGANFHCVGLVRINGNDFTEVDYAFYLDHGTAPDSWMHANDIKFNDNYINRANVTHVWVKGVDGISINDNVMFSIAYSSSDAALKAKKENNIYVGQCDWLEIRGNKLFEAGLEAIVLDMQRHFIIEGNHIAWPGQREPSSAIKLTGTNQPFGVIKSNVLSRFTKHAVEISANLGVGAITSVRVADNLIEYDPTTPSYYGTTPLSSIPHYDVFVDPNSQVRVTESGNFRSTVIINNNRGSTSSRVEFNLNSGVEGAQVRATVTAADTKIANLSWRDLGEGNSYTGLLFITAKTGLGPNSDVASYLLHITRLQGGTATATLVSSGGLTTGGGASHPSFTFSVDGASNELRATPVGSTSGTFYFCITAIGSIRVY